MSPLAYMASPYSRYPNGVREAFEQACHIAARLLLTGIKVYSPIAHTHSLATIGGIDPLDHSIWMPYDEAMMRVCDVLIVAHMPGWETSKGIAIEVRHFEMAGKPIFDLDPNTLVMTRRNSAPPHSDQRFYDAI
jgi:Domain of unknown function (DUF1937)